MSRHVISSADLDVDVECDRCSGAGRLYLPTRNAQSTSVTTMNTALTQVKAIDTSTGGEVFFKSQFVTPLVPVF